MGRMSVVMGVLLMAGTAGAVETRGPGIDAVFVLDTTGSMGGLLEGAKRKIWAIANEMARGKPTPRIRIGLVAYRDHGDAYVTQITDLTDDLDKVYERLSALKADGGGDTPEDIKSGLFDAVRKVSWGTDKKTARLVFLVGDAPAHLEYKDTPVLEDILKQAVAKDIRVNAIRCGGDREAGLQFQRIAMLGEGKFFSIGEDGNVNAVATPYDKEMAELDRRIGGPAPSAMAGAALESVVSRAAYKSASGAYDAGGSASAAESKRMAELSRKRDAYLRAEALKSGTADAFDAKVLEALKAEAKEKGIAY